MARRGPSRTFGTAVGAILHHASYGDYSRFTPGQGWAPPVNVYQLVGRLAVCMDLAGVDRERVEARVEPCLLIIEGVRPAPDPKQDETGGAMRILSMEIDHGPFRRQIRLPENVLLERVTSSYDRGLLWVNLPLSPR